MEENIQEMNFETAFTALQENVAKLEGDELTLEESLTLYKRGQALAKRCAELLEQAELEVRTLSMDATQPIENQE
jgi:exodeoxyribonuclease VII small subunit